MRNIIAPGRGLTALAPSIQASAGHAVPTRRALSERRVKLTTRPPARPARPYFSSGPCAKRPGWDAANLRTEVLGRSHRSKPGKARLKHAIDLTREILQV